jgi:hypothetical protein
MQRATMMRRSSGTRQAILRRLLFGLALLTLAVGALPARHAAAGGPTIVARYGSFPGEGEWVNVSGDGFTPGGSVTVWVLNESNGEWASATATASWASYSYVCLGGSTCWWNETSPGGRFAVSVSVYCANSIAVYAIDRTTGQVASTRIPGRYCPG